MNRLCALVWTPLLLVSPHLAAAQELPASPPDSVAAHYPRVEGIRVEGARQIRPERVRERLRLAVPFEAAPGVLEAGLDRVLEAYRAAGFLRAEATAGLEPRGGDRGYELVVSVRENERARVGEVTLEGCRGLPEERVRRAVELRHGRWLNQRVLLADIDRILSLYEEEGFPFARVAPGGFAIDSTGGAIGVELQVREGSKVRVRALQVWGNDVTRRRTIEREMRFRSGEIYRQSRIDRGLARLARSGLFREVGQPGLRPSPNGREVTLELDVVEGPMNSIEGGLGYVPASGTIDEGYVTGQIDLRLGNIAGTGRAAAFRWQRLAPESAIWRIAYHEPWLGGLPLSANIAIHQEVRDSTYTTRGAELGLVFPFSYAFELSGDVLRERTITGSRGFGVEEESHRSTFYGGVRVDLRDRAVNPTRGLRADLRIGRGRRDVEREVAGDSTGAPGFTARYRETSAEMTWGVYQGAGASRVVAFEGEVHTLQSPDARIPFYRLFFQGGSEGPRGYAEDQFSGQTVARGALEYRVHLGPRSRFHFFLDLGYDAWKGDVNRHWGYGAGLRLESRIGRLGLDLGLPLGDPLSDGKLHLRLAEEW